MAAEKRIEEVAHTSQLLSSLSSKVKFENPKCGHSEQTLTVTRLEGGVPTILCQSCFELVADSDRESRKPPFDENLQCLFCFMSGSRFFIDLNAPICDSCQEQSERMLFLSEKNYVPRSSCPDEVSPGVFVGPKDSAWDRAILRDLGIKRILICCDRLKAYHHESGNRDRVTDSSIKYHRLPLQDSLSQNLVSYLPSARAFIADGLLNGENCLVHCNAGVSRSGTVIVDWIYQTVTHQQRHQHGLGEFPPVSPAFEIEDALQMAKEKRPIITPNSNFMHQMKDEIMRSRNACAEV